MLAEDGVGPVANVAAPVPVIVTAEGVTLLAGVVPRLFTCAVRVIVAPTVKVPGESDREPVRFAAATVTIWKELLLSE
jgi:hypothetical protein